MTIAIEQLPVSRSKFRISFARIMLAALVDRGERELPIAADFVAHTLALQSGERLVLQRADDGKLSFTVDHA